VPAPPLAAAFGRAGAVHALGLAASALTGPGWSLWKPALAGVRLGLGVMAWTGLYLAAAVAAAPADASTVSAGAKMFTFAGAVAGPPRFGLAVEPLGGYPAGFAGAAAVAVVAPASAGRRPRVQEETSDGDPCDHR
jgi:hypothetical protein